MKQTYIIGEIGQNHNGSVDIAKLLVDLVSRPVKEELFNLELTPMDAVKLTKRDLREELSASQMQQPYNSPHSFGKLMENTETIWSFQTKNTLKFTNMQKAKDYNLLRLFVR